MQGAVYEILPAREADVCWAAALGQRVYHGSDAIPERQMLEWYGVNPHGFSTFWCDGVRVGNFDLLPLRPAAMEGFAAGRLREADLCGADLFSAAEGGSIRQVHFESIALDPEFRRGRSSMLTLFVVQYVELLRRVCPEPQLEGVTAIAASHAGARILRRLGFFEAGAASARLDGHPLYRGTIASYRAAMLRRRS